MPQNLELAFFMVGAVLMLLALSSGGFKIFGAEMSGVSGRWSRLAAGFVGLGLIITAAMQVLKLPDHQAAVTPPVTNGELSKPQRLPPADGHPNNTMTAPQPVNVQCTSDGEACDRTADIAGPFPNSLTIRAGAGCSKVKYTIHFLRRQSGFAVEEVSAATTRPLGPFEAEEVSVDPQAVSARISAEGVRGDCNEGRLASWNIIVSSGGEGS